MTGLVGTIVALDRDYDSDGNRRGLTTNFGGTLSGTSVVGGVKDSVVNLGYDAMNRVWAISQSTANQGSASGVNTVAAKSAYFEFNAASQVTNLRRYNSTGNSSTNLKAHTRYAYDDAGRLTSITHGKTEIASGEAWDGTSTLPASLGSFAWVRLGFRFHFGVDSPRLYRPNVLKRRFLVRGPREWSGALGCKTEDQV